MMLKSQVITNDTIVGDVNTEYNDNCPFVALWNTEQLHVVEEDVFTFRNNNITLVTRFVVNQWELFEH